VEVFVGSDMTTDSTIVTSSSNTLAANGLQFEGVLNVVGGAGLNAGMLKNLEGRDFSDAGTAAGFRSGGQP
jgi:hypothetical protein